MRRAATEIHMWRQECRRGEERVLNLNIIILRSMFLQRGAFPLSFRLSCRAFAHSYRSFTHISESFLLPVPRMVFFRNFRGKDMGLSGDAGGVSGCFFLCLFRHFFLAFHRYFFTVYLA